MPYEDHDKYLAYQRAYAKAHRKEAVERSSAWQASHRDRFNATQREMYHRDVDKQRERSRSYHAEHPEKAQNRSLKRKYGINLTQYNALAAEQCGSCSICGRVPCEDPDVSKTVQRLVVDHDHETGKIRGLICHKCNRALGLFGDDPSVVSKAAEYMS